MPQLEFKYSSDQSHQVNAVNAVCDLFRGQEFISAEFTAYAEEIDFGRNENYGHDRWPRQRLACLASPAY